MNLKQIVFIKYGLLIILLTAVTAFFLLWILEVDGRPLLNMIIAYFLNQPIC